jgi:hypothetical protein
METGKWMRLRGRAEGTGQRTCGRRRKTSVEINSLEVEVVDLPVSQLLLDHGSDVLLGVEGVPELGGDD